MRILKASLMVALVVVPKVSLGGWFSSSEVVQLEPYLSDPQSLNDTMYVKATGASSDVVGFCNDSFLRALGRNAVGVNNKTMLLLTYDNIPILSAKYEQNGRNCSKEYILSRDITGYSLLDGMNKEHKFNLVYAVDEKVTTLQSAVDTFKSVAAATNPIAAVMAKPIAREMAVIIDNAIASASSTVDNQTVTFRLPDDNDANKSKMMLYARIGGIKYYLVDINMQSKKSLFEDKSADRIMYTQLDGASSIIAGLKDRRAKEGIAYSSGSFSTIENECGSLKASYGQRLNSYDGQRLLEAYLLDQHRRHISKRTLGMCLGFTVNDPDRELTFKLIADELRAPVEVVDTFFVRYLNAAEYKQVAKSDIKINDIDTGLRISKLSEYVQLRASSPACHTAMAYNRVGFIQAVGGQSYYVTVTVDKLYSKDETARGAKPKLLNMSISTQPDIEYTSIPRVSQCVSEWRQGSKGSDRWVSASLN
ncbi:hypothetical protein D3C76_249910 [compost metagenome]